LDFVVLAILGDGQAQTATSSGHLTKMFKLFERNRNRMINPHPGLPEFDYVKFKTLSEASQFLAQNAGEARPFSGGTDCFVRMRDGHWKQKYMVDIKGLDGTNVLTFDPASGLTIGAAISMNRVIAHPDVQRMYPLLAESAHSVASYQLRSRATIIGNVCNSSPAGDTIGACMLYQGAVNVHGIDGVRKEPLATFFKGPGRNALRPGDIVTSITIPIPPQKHAGRYLKVNRNLVGDLAIVGVTALGYPDPSTRSGYRFLLALASVAPVPFIPTPVETILAEKPITDATIAEAAQAAMDACSPIDDVRGTAQYRKYMVRNMTRQAVSDVWNRIR
jgi:CO/xanthine dehydrogenase FAD-binding subunit